MPRRSPIAVTLLRTFEGVDHLVEKGTPLPPFDLKDAVLGVDARLAADL